MSSPAPSSAKCIAPISQHVYLDMTTKSKEFLEKRFPRIYATCLSYGLDLSSDSLPSVPPRIS